MKCKKWGHSALSILMLGCWAGGVGFRECAGQLKGCVLACAPQVAGRTNDAAGDGTTTASVLAREMIHYGLQVGTPIWLLAVAAPQQLSVCGCPGKLRRVNSGR